MQDSPPPEIQDWDIGKKPLAIDGTMISNDEVNTIRPPSRCRLRTSVERILLIFLLIVSFLCALLVMLLTTQRSSLLRAATSCPAEDCSSNSCIPICLTEVCVAAASGLLQNMDFSASPCEDFYKYACGRWHQHHDLPSDHAYYNTFSVLRDQMHIQLRDLLEEPISENDSNATTLAKHLYASCMNEDVIEQLQERPLLELIKKLGGWPMLSESWSGEGFDWLRLVAILKTYNNDILIGQWVSPDGKNSSMNIIQLDQTELSLPSKEYYVPGSPQLQAYGRFMVTIAELLGANKTHRAEQDMNDVLAFEMLLANISVPNGERRNYTAIYYKITLKELQQQISLINWTLYFDISMPMKIPEDEEIIVYGIPYLLSVTELVTSTPKRVIANYLMWMFIKNRVSSLDKRFLANQQVFFHALHGTKAMLNRWKRCTDYVNKNMAMSVGSLFVKKHFNEKSKETAVKMIEDIKKAFLELLEEVDWMDDETRKAAHEKAEVMTEKIGLPEYILDRDKLDKEFEGIEFKPDTYFENILIYLQHTAKNEQLKLRKPVDKTEWITSPAVINAFYTRSKNFITLPAGILQPPVYHQNYVKSLNYGGIGVVIGHEITHGFDDKGRQFDQHGNLKQWWNKESLEMFQQKAECIVKQYGNYVMDDVNLKINGVVTQGENIADNGGVKQAFRAYKNWQSRNKQEPLLPGLNLTHYQLFFLNYAQIWCGVSRPQHSVNVARAGSHTPGNFRVIGALSNSKDFNEAFGCPLGSPMNPVHKCEVW